MNLRKGLFSIFSITLFALGAWVVILFNLNPWQSDSLIFIGFMASLFLWLAGLITLIEFGIRILFGQGEVIYANLPVSSRHGILIALSVILILSLQLLRVLNILEIILIIVVIGISELYFKTRSYA